jgi:hypothetical protein
VYTKTEKALGLVLDNARVELGLARETIENLRMQLAVAELAEQHHANNSTKGEVRCWKEGVKWAKARVATQQENRKHALREWLVHVSAIKEVSAATKVIQKYFRGKEVQKHVVL